MTSASDGVAPPLPDVHQADVDGQTVADLLRDVSLAAELLEVVVKGGAQAQAREGAMDLERAGTLLLSGAVRGVQLRYRHHGDEWWDTLLAVPGGFRVVRIRQAPPPGRR